MRRVPRLSLWIVLVAAFLAASSGCGRDRPALVTPAAPAGDFYPLAVGNQWRYALSRTVLIVLNGDTLAPTVQHLIEERELVAVDTTSGDTYFVEHSRLFDAAGTDTLHDTRFLRQDDTGLYAAGGAGGEESTLLSYPLEPGARWIVNPQGPPVTLIVEGADTLGLAGGFVGAYRIRRESLSLSPEDSSHVWYGYCGRIRSAVHRETMAMDVLTGDIALIVTDDATELAGVSLVSPGRCPVFP
ncbi:MAG: hypothetical protein ACE5EO_09000 [Candidatus Krumholzibacteriia bacterium]